MTTIITHGGQSHRDEFIACCLIAALDRSTESIKRVPHSLFHFNMQGAGDYVVDVGLEHNPHMRRFDHHQFERSRPCEAAFSLVAKYFGMEQCESVFSWWNVSCELDVRGPKAVSERYGITTDELYSFMSPIEAQLLRLFEQQETIDGQFFALMRSMGIGWSEYLHDTLRARKVYAEKAIVVTAETLVGEINYLDATMIADQNDAVSRQMAVEKCCAVIVSKDKTGQGVSLFRVDDDPRIDFSQLIGDPDILFAHKGGFIAKTKTQDVNIQDLIVKALQADCVF